jgi:CRISPR-associated protein Csm2
MPFHYKTSFQPTWIADKINEDCITYLSDLGMFLCDKRIADERPGNAGVTTAQLRNIFSEVKRIELKLDDTDYDWKTEFVLLRPKIAYNTARTLQRTRGSRMKELREVLELAQKEVRDVNTDKAKSQFHNFSKFFEGIIAYHKVFGGKD